MGLLRGWTPGFCPLNEIERSLSTLLDARQARPVQLTAAAVTPQDMMAMVQPGDVLLDCTGTRWVLRDHLLAGAADGEANTFKLSWRDCWRGATWR